LLVNFVSNIFAVLATSKFKLVRAAVGKIYSQTVSTKLTPEKASSINVL